MNLPACAKPFSVRKRVSPDQILQACVYVEVSTGMVCTDSVPVIMESTQLFGDSKQTTLRMQVCLGLDL